MILVHKLRGEPLHLNCDMIESIEQTPDTLVTLTDGRKILLADAPDAIVARVIDFKAAIRARARQLDLDTEER